jgi:Cu-Zn family superoxide dismutase
MKTSVYFTAVSLIVGLGLSARAEIGIAQIRGTAPDSKVAGTAMFMDTKDGLKVTVNMTGAPAGQHGFHIHEFGSCEDLGKAAGGHYNPLSSPHGMISKDGAKHAHKGDLGNIEIAADGTGKLEALISGLSLSDGKYTAAGRAVILHEKGDDFGQPVGNAGGRIGCGPIVVTGK